MAAMENTGNEHLSGSPDYPDFIARFYDLIYHQVRDPIDKKYYQNKINETRGRILEAGTGTGRLLLESLKNDADIYGIDISPAMLNVLKNKLGKNDQHRISLQSITDFSFDRPFNLIVAPFRVLMHLLTKEDQIKALKNVSRHLEPGGRFIFDVFVPDPNYLIKGMDNVTDFEGEYEPGKKIRRIVSTQPDIVNQIIEVNFRYEWSNNGEVITKEWKTPMRFFFKYELEHLIERSGFCKFKFDGDFEGNPLQKGSKEFIVTCEKT